MKKTLLFFVFMLVLSGIATAVTVDPDVTFEDGTYTYIVNSQITVNTIKVTLDELYLDSTPFCSWGNVAKFSTARLCPTYPALESTEESLLSKFAMVPVWVGIIIVVFFAMLLLKLWDGNVISDEITIFLMQVLGAVIVLVIGMIIIAALFA